MTNTDTPDALRFGSVRSPIVAMPDGSAIHCDYIKAIVVRSPSLPGVVVHMGENGRVPLCCVDEHAAVALAAQLTRGWEVALGWRAALGERTEPEQPAGNADDLWKSVPEGTDIDDMFGPDPDPEQPAVAEIKEGYRVKLADPRDQSLGLGTVMGVSREPAPGVAGVNHRRTAWVRWDSSTAYDPPTGYTFDELEPS